MNRTAAEQVLVFKTNISSRAEAERLQPVLNNKAIVKWNLDMEDCDRVLRIVTKGFPSDEIISFAKREGLECEELE
jgi:hypothetical protein